MSDGNRPLMGTANRIPPKGGSGTAPPMVFSKPAIEDLAFRFDHHPPRDTEHAARYVAVRHAIKQAAVECVRITPVSPEQTRALNALDEAMFLFNAALARHEE